MNNQKYIKPTFESNAFTCPHCGVYAQQKFIPRFYHYISPGIPDQPGVSICINCQRATTWVNNSIVFPPSNPYPEPHPDMPAECMPDYNEARLIASSSPRGAASLLRLVIQNLMKALGEKGHNTSEDIKSLVQKGMSERIQKALDICRVVGNHSVHPGALDVNANPELVTQLFSLINFIVDDRITKPKEIDLMFEALPDRDKLSIAKRDNS